MFGALKRFRRWLFQENDEARRGPRLSQPELIVHYWNGSATGGRDIRDISEQGAYICTPEHWYPGTIIRVVLAGKQMTVGRDNAPVPGVSTCVTSRVVRNSKDGVAVEFIFHHKREQEDFRKFLTEIPKPAAEGGYPAMEPHSGQALVELALILPLVFLLAVNAVNFGGFIYAWITVAGAARDGAEYMVMSSASSGSPSPATLGQVTALIANDVTSLLNKSSIVVATCTNATTSANGCTTLSDPEAPSYTLATVDVTYTYHPFIPLFSFPRLGISATLPSSTIHRKAVMRMLQ